MNHPEFTSKEELENYLYHADLPGIDAEFSKSTLELIRKFEAQGADLNKWWVMTPVGWRCPACKRSKEQIVRVNRHGYLRCHLHAHHDHIKGHVRKRFESISSNKKQVVADELAERFAIRAAFALSAYDTTIICADCNEIESKAKAAANTHADFSYSPYEIGLLIHVTNNKEHEVDSEVAKSIWLTGLETFSLRMKMVEQYAEIAASKQHWYQPSDETAAQTDRGANYWFRRYGLDNISCDSERLLYTPESFVGNYSSWRKKNNPVCTHVPSEGEIQQLINTRGNFWKNYSNDWSCPCCQRSKVKSIRRSRSKRWVFEVKCLLLFNEQSSEWAGKFCICNDCSNAAIHIGREACKQCIDIDVPYSSSLVSLDELKAIVLPRDHSLHNINNDGVERLLPNLIDRITKGMYHLSTNCEARYPGDVM